MTTYHALKRTHERTGLNIKSSAKFIANAIERGKSINTYREKEKNYMLRRELKKGCRTLIYNKYCFILNNENCCITMYSVPEWFEKKKNYDGKRKIKNIKKYIRYYNLFEQQEIL